MTPQHPAEAHELVVESRPDPVRHSVPVRFGPPGGPLREIEAVLDWWPGERHRWFRVRLPDGSETILRQDLATGAWRIDFYARDGRTRS